jgi:hypothetical protein
MMSKKVHASKAATQPGRRRIAVRLPSATPETMLRALVARVDLIPEYTEILDLEAERALVAAFIEHHVGEDSRDEVRSFEADRTRDEAALKAALPTDLQAVLFTFVEREGTMRWIREEIVYALGIEVGRRLSGAAQ